MGGLAVAVTDGQRDGGECERRNHVQERGWWGLCIPSKKIKK